MTITPSSAELAARDARRCRAMTILAPALLALAAACATPPQDPEPVAAPPVPAPAVATPAPGAQAAQAAAAAAPAAVLPTVAAPVERTPVVAFVDVSVVPMDRDRVQERQTVVVRDGRIAEVGPTASVRVPEGAVRVDGRGKFLMPGFAEMHGHLPSGPGINTEATLMLFVANGVTFVRGMQGHAYQLELRRAIERGELLGPTLRLAGLALSGNSARTVEDAERMVREQHAAGYDLLKIAEGLSPDVYRAIISTARQVGIRNGGHIPDAVGFQTAIEARQGTIDHLDNYVEEIFAATQELPAAQRATERRRRLAAAAGETRRAGVAVVPTMRLWELIVQGGDTAELLRRPELRYMPRNTVANWTNFANQRRAQAASGAADVLEARRHLLKAMSDSGVVILFGTDAPQFFSVPGFSIHREMRAMSESGVSNYQILRSGTRAIAEHYGAESDFGTVQPGRRADLILLDGNPISDLGNMERRAGVMLRGSWIPELEIQRRLALISSRYAAN